MDGMYTEDDIKAILLPLRRLEEHQYSTISCYIDRYKVKKCWKCGETGNIVSLIYMENECNEGGTWIERKSCMNHNCFDQILHKFLSDVKVQISAVIEEHQHSLDIAMSIQ
jgi:hypothetical protein